MSSIIQKTKDAIDKVVHPDHHKTGTAADGSTHTKHHEPRVDGHHVKDEEKVDTIAYPSAATGLTSLGTSSHIIRDPVHHDKTHGTSTNAGPHNSSLANKADPRVDSNLDGSRTVGAGTTTAGTTGTAGTVGTAGTTGHTGTTGVGGTAGLAGSGPGPAPNTAGPHGSDLLNKADPRVDSDLDGSKTVGGNQTYQ